MIISFICGCNNPGLMHVKASISLCAVGGSGYETNYGKDNSDCYYLEVDSPMSGDDTLTESN